MRSSTPRVGAAVVLFVAGCSVTRVKVQEQRVSAPGSPIALSASAIKFNKDKYDLTFGIANQAASAVMIMSEDVRCGRGSTTGRIEDDILGQRGKTINISAGKARSFSIGCETPGQVSGDFEITVDTVYANTSGDGVTKGAILASGVTIVVDPSGRVAGGEPLTGKPPPEEEEEPSKGKSMMSSLFSALNPNPSKPPPPKTVTPPPKSETSQPSGQSPPVQSPPAEAHTEAHPVLAHPDWVIAVMDIEDTNSDSKKALGKGLVQNIGDQLRVYIVQNGVRTIDRGAQDRIVKEQIKREKSESYKSCYNDSCQIELGKALAASHILRARITRFGSKCVLNAELIDLRSEVTIGASTAQGDCGDEGFLGMCDTVAKNLLKTH